jgi:hypothetical protein
MIAAMSASTGTTVAMLVAALVLLGLGMIAVALWLVRSTRTDPRALGPLEVMGDRRWRKADADRRRTNLDTARPEGAAPPAPMLAVESADGDSAEGDSAEGDSAEKCESSMQESAVSAHTSEDEPADAGSDVEADTAE